MTDDVTRPTSVLPSRPIQKLTRPFERFLHVEAAAGAILVAATTLALLAANSGFAESYAALWEQRLQIRVANLNLDYPLWYWVNDGLMAIFFFVIGLEIKRELVWGELRDRRAVVLPFVGAVGGAGVPVVIYVALQPSAPGGAGWAVPMATDIAFVVGCLALLGRRVPMGLKVFVLSLAIIDDIFAVVVIAAFFTGSIHVGWLLGAVSGFACIGVLNRAGVRRVGAYVLVGGSIWLCTLKSGVHPTVAGALLGLLTPASAWLGDSSLLDVITDVTRRLSSAKAEGHGGARREALQDLAFASHESVSPLERLESRLHPWVGFGIMPLFALANAGVAIDVDGITDPIALSVCAALALGKPVGIGVSSFLVVKVGFARLPPGVSWPALVGASSLAGIGFTMSLFVASLSLDGSALAAAKAGILLASALSLASGLTVLRLALR